MTIIIIIIIIVVVVVIIISLQSKILYLSRLLVVSVSRGWAGNLRISDGRNKK